MTDLPEAAKASRADRIARVRQRMEALDVDVLLLSLGADLPWLTGYQAMPLERLTMLVLPVRGDPVLVVPGLEAPRVARADEVFGVLPWSDAENPVGIVASMVATRVAGRGKPGPLRVAISDRTWATSVLALQSEIPRAEWITGSTVTSPIRAVKDAGELEALRAASGAADRVADRLQRGDIRVIGRREAEVSSDISERLLAEGHRQVNFAIVGSGPNAASPHHEPGSRVIGPNETVVCDFGGSLSLDGEVGYCSDITRTVVTGEPTAQVAECYEVLLAAQQSAVAAARDGIPAEAVDAVARKIIEDAGYGDLFIHRTGHGIGIEEHEDPYLVAGNHDPLRPGHAFSVEPGIYVPGQFGMRLEDIVIINDDGSSESLNTVSHRLAVVEA
ncbi:MAG TPA: Xaa-Pro peptidase family protein [Acidimicrobiales bacterium]|nr:Xaa-Pro peptidase family protein [Acidimicrobiales bacterium]